MTLAHSLLRDVGQHLCTDPQAADVRHHTTLAPLLVLHLRVKSSWLPCGQSDGRVLDQLMGSQEGVGLCSNLLVSDLAFAQRVCDSAYVVSQYQALAPAELLTRLAEAGFRALHVHEAPPVRSGSGTRMVQSWAGAAQPQEDTNNKLRGAPSADAAQASQQPEPEPAPEPEPEPEPKEAWAAAPSPPRETDTAEITFGDFGDGKTTTQPQPQAPNAPAAHADDNADEERESRPLTTLPAQAAAPAAEGSRPLSPRRQAMGGRLYALVSELQPAMAAKITGMLLENDAEMVAAVLEDPTELAETVAEAARVLRESTFVEQHWAHLVTEPRPGPVAEGGPGPSEAEVAAQQAHFAQCMAAQQRYEAAVYQQQQALYHQQQQHHHHHQQQQQQQHQQQQQSSNNNSNDNNNIL